MTLIETDEAVITLTNLQHLCKTWLEGEILIEDMLDEVCTTHTVRQLRQLVKILEGNQAKTNKN